MLEMALLMILGKLHTNGGASWQWALGFAVVGGLLFGFSVSLYAVILFAVRFGVAWLYFFLLNQFEDNVALYLTVYILMPLGLWGLAAI